MYVDVNGSNDLVLMISVNCVGVNFALFDTSLPPSVLSPNAWINHVVQPESIPGALVFSGVYVSNLRLLSHIDRSLVDDLVARGVLVAEDRHEPADVTILRFFKTNPTSQDIGISSIFMRVLSCGDYRRLHFSGLSPSTLSLRPL